MGNDDKELFDMVYGWGKNRIVADEHSPAFKKTLGNIKKKTGSIKRFVDDCNTEYPEFNLSLSGGYIDEEGIICNAQYGALDTFSIGMPIYTEDGEEIGRLSIGLFKNLDYAKKAGELDIPVEYWLVNDYSGKRQSIKTYWQITTPPNNKETI